MVYSIWWSYDSYFRRIWVEERRIKCFAIASIRSQSCMNDGYAKSKLYGGLSDKQVTAEDLFQRSAKSIVYSFPMYSIYYRRTIISHLKCSRSEVFLCLNWVLKTILPTPCSIGESHKNKCSVKFESIVDWNLLLIAKPISMRAIERCHAVLGRSAQNTTLRTVAKSFLRERCNFISLSAIFWFHFKVLYEMK